MPMEHIRQRLAADAGLYPEFGGPRKGMRRPQLFVSSTSTAVSVPKTKKAPRSTVIISSDEEDDESVKIIDSEIRKYLEGNKAGTGVKPPGKPLHIPSNKDIPIQNRIPSGGSQPKDTEQGDGELIDVPDFHDDYQVMSTTEAEKALRDLMGGGMNEEIETEINMEDATVKGFKEGISLLPHQIIGRAWMRDREDISKKRSGGILADDMGLGKTIQTLTRIVEGRARKSDAQDGWAATTLVVCPLALVGQWADEIQKMAVGLTVIKHHGTSRTGDPAALRRAHVVVTTYDVVKSEYASYSPPAKDESKSKTKKKAKDASDVDSDDSGEHFGRTLMAKKKTPRASAKKDALFHVQWWRIVLDEAHNIKNEKTKGAVACCELHGKFRWCLTGTPMQNNVVELYSLIKFLRIKPLSNWDTFNNQIAKPVKSGRGASRAMKRLQVVLKQIMLRRRKDQTLNGKALIELPKRLVNVVSCPFDSSERAFYDALEGKMESVIEKLMGKGGSNYIGVLLLLLRLRQACNHPILVAKDYKKDLDAVEPKSSKKAGDDNEEDGDDLAAAFGQLGVTRKCQVCTSELSAKNAGEGEWDTHCVDCIPLAKQARLAEENRPSSAKIRMILKLLGDIGERSEGEEKTIIFSQFTSMLDLIEPFLQENNIKYVRYDGSMAPADREMSLDRIKKSNSIRVILISFKAGSTGLNLTACNNVILVDLWWNPALEDQAFDRSHRFGQTRDVNIFKLKIDGTVEDRILDLQEKKRELARAALSGDKIKNMRLGMDDLLALFRPGGRDDDEEDYE
ncbi:SNF2 family N-terminal domain-containing protein [Infundibulicybe gibba]|nr:SNF2 family N-terminal domain-containing protein [Infundibulicybe gibba]